jgi:hypothetical protein
VDYFESKNDVRVQCIANIQRNMNLLCFSFSQSTPIENIISSPERDNVTDTQNLNAKLNYAFDDDEFNVNSSNSISIDNKVMLLIL